MSNFREPLVDTLFDMVYYINLNKDNDRRAHMMNVLKLNGLTKVTRIRGIEGSKKPPAHHYRNFMKKDDPKYISGHCGCKYSHVNVAAHAKAMGYKKVLVFEDDIIFRESLSSILEYNLKILISDYDLCYLGGRELGDHAGGIIDTHAYAMSDKIYDDIIHLAIPSGYEIDIFYSGFFNYLSWKYNVTRVHDLNLICQDKSFGSNISV